MMDLEEHLAKVLAHERSGPVPPDVWADLVSRAYWKIVDCGFDPRGHESVVRMMAMHEYFRMTDPDYHGGGRVDLLRQGLPLLSEPPR